VSSRGRRARVLPPIEVGRTRFNLLFGSLAWLEGTDCTPSHDLLAAVAAQGVAFDLV
jgi:hypothetical protein